MRNLITILALFFSVVVIAQPDTINFGTTPNDGTGDNLRETAVKINNNDQSGWSDFSGKYYNSTPNLTDREDTERIMIYRNDTAYTISLDALFRNSLFIQSISANVDAGFDTIVMAVSGAYVNDIAPNQWVINFNESLNVALSIDDTLGIAFTAREDGGAYTVDSVVVDDGGVVLYGDTVTPGALLDISYTPKFSGGVYDRSNNQLGTLTQVPISNNHVGDSVLAVDAWYRAENALTDYSGNGYNLYEDNIYSMLYNSTDFIEGAASFQWSSSTRDIFISDDFVLNDTFTIAGWFKSDGTAANLYILYSVDGATGYYLGLDGANRAMDFLSKDGTNHLTRTANGIYTYGVMTHFACVVEGSTNVDLYIDGVLSVVAEDVTSFLTTNSIEVGKLFDDQIDDIQIYNRSIPADSILILSNNPGNPLKTGGLVVPGDTVLGGEPWDDVYTTYFEVNFNNFDLTGSLSQAAFESSSGYDIHHTNGFSTGRVDVLDIPSNGNGEASRGIYNTLPANTVGPDDGWAFKYTLPADVKDVYFSVNMMFPTDTWWDSGKLPPGILTQRAGFEWYGVLHDLHDGFSVRNLMYDWDGQRFGAGIYYYIPNDTAKYGNASIRAPYFDFNPLRWYNVTIRVLENTFTNDIANADGDIELFVDGVLVNALNDVVIISNSDKSIETVYFDHFMGGSLPTASDKNEHAWFDDAHAFGPDIGTREPASLPGRELNLKYWDRSTGDKLNTGN